MKLFTAVVVVLLAHLPSLPAQPAPQPPVTVVSNVEPDRVATALMPNPIFPFAVHTIAYSPDGKMLATGNGEGAVRLWNTKAGELLITKPAHTNWAFSIDWSKGGTSFATGGGDDLVNVFSIKDLASAPRVFSGHTADVHAVQLTRDDRVIFSAGDDRQIIRWNARTGKLDRQWLAHDKPIPTLSLSPDGRILASGSRDDTIKLWNADTGELKARLLGHTNDVMSVRFSPDGKLLASAGYDTTVRLWNVATGKTLKVFVGHVNRVFNVAFSPDGKRLVSVGDSTARVWDVASEKEIRTITPGGIIQAGITPVTENLSAVAFSPDGNTLAISSTSGVVYLVSAESGTIVRTLSPPKPSRP